MTEAVRQPHCVPGKPHRLEKARKIHAILSRRRSFVGARLLEVGCGSGRMASAFAEMVGPSGEVVAVDAHDQREVTEGYAFEKVADASLPFPDERFDLVVSNHVMEHVGAHDDQRLHLAEIRRALVPGGFAYFAVPNRWRLVEPHFRLPLLSWLPPKLADLYVRLARKGNWYDVEPPSARTMAALLGGSGLDWEDCTLEAIRMMPQVEPSSGPLARALSRAPAWVLRLGSPLVPTMIYVGRRPHA